MDFRKSLKFSIQTRDEGLTRFCSRALLGKQRKAAKIIDLTSIRSDMEKGDRKSTLFI